MDEFAVGLDASLAGDGGPFAVVVKKAEVNVRVRG